MKTYIFIEELREALHVEDSEVKAFHGDDRWQFIENCKKYIWIFSCFLPDPVTQIDPLTFSQLISNRFFF